MEGNIVAPFGPNNPCFCKLPCFGTISTKMKGLTPKLWAKSSDGAIPCSENGNDSSIDIIDVTETNGKYCEEESDLDKTDQESFGTNSTITSNSILVYSYYIIHTWERFLAAAISKILKGAKSVLCWGSNWFLIQILKCHQRFKKTSTEAKLKSYSGRKGFIWVGNLLSARSLCKS